MGLFQNLTGWHAIIILAAILLLFGATRLPALAKSVGQSMNIFKTELRDVAGPPPATSTAAPAAATATTASVPSAATTAAPSAAATPTAAPNAAATPTAAPNAAATTIAAPSATSPAVSDPAVAPATGRGAVGPVSAAHRGD